MTPDAPEQRPEGERPAAHPRLRARRIQVAREAGRRRLRGFFVAGGVFVVLIAMIAALLSPLASVGRVRVTGAVYTDQAAVDAVVRSVHGTPMILVNAGSVERKLEALPWVKRATVTRSWPRSIHVDLLERRPSAAYLGADNQYRVIDEEGRVLAVLDGQPTTLVPVVATGRAFGPGPALPAGATAPPSLAATAALLHVLPDELRTLTSEAGLDQDGNVVLKLTTGGLVKMGAPGDAVRDKLLAVLTIIHKEGGAGSIQELDVSVAARPTCTGCTNLGGTPTSTPSSTPGNGTKALTAGQG
jgi:cell division protein FtsQ